MSNEGKVTTLRKWMMKIVSDLMQDRNNDELTLVSIISMAFPAKTTLLEH